MKKVNVLFLIVSVLFFTLACQNDTDPDPDNDPVIPAVLQNTEWTHTSGDKISFTKDSVTITPAGKSAQTFKLKDTSYVSQGGTEQTILYFKSKDSPDDTITFLNDTIEMVNFSIINTLNRAKGWSEGNNNNNNNNNIIIGTGTYGDFAYSYTSSSVTITGYTGNGGDVIIPSVIDGKPVTAIADGIDYTGVFTEKKLTSVTIGNNVTSIGRGAFSGNQLTNVVIPNSVTYIGEGAFGWNRITSVNIPYNITSLESNVFYGNELTTITIPNSVTSIGEGAFASNQLTSVTIPSSVTSIGNYAFNNNQKLTSITIPDSVISIGDDIFTGCDKIISITIGANVSYDVSFLYGRGFDIAYQQNNKAAGTYTRIYVTLPGREDIVESTEWTKIN